MKITYWLQHFFVNQQESSRRIVVGLGTLTKRICPTLKALKTTTCTVSVTVSCSADGPTNSFVEAVCF